MGQKKRIVSSILAVLMLTVAWASMIPNEVSAEETDNNKRFIMYYGDWSLEDRQGNFVPDKMPADYYTHLNYAFIDFDENGDLVYTDEQAALEAIAGIPNAQEGTPTSGLFTAFQRLKQNNPKLKIGISLGGWAKSGDFSVVCADDEKRANLVNQTLKLVEYTDMDFVDVDWEYPGNIRQPDLVDDEDDEGTPNAGPEDGPNYIKLLQDLRDGLDAQGERVDKKYELSVAVSANPNVIAEGTDIPAVFNIVDFANVMTYDMNGAWNGSSAHHANLYHNPNDPASRAISVNDSVQHYLASGAPAEKIVIGAAFYTRGWEKITAGSEPDPTTPGLFGIAEPAEGTWQVGALNELPLVSGDGGWRAGIWSYRNLDKLHEAYPGLQEYWDDTSKAAYLYSPTTGAFFTYENVRSVTEKANYVNNNDLGGMIVWMASQDAPDQNGERNELSSAIYETLFDVDTRPLNTNGFTDTYAIDAEVVKEDNQIKVSITNTATLEETNEKLQVLEKRHKTIKLPVFTITLGEVQKEAPKVVTFDDTYVAPGETLSFTVPLDQAVGNVETITIGQRFSTADETYAQAALEYKYTDATTPAPEPTPNPDPTPDPTTPPTAETGGTKPGQNGTNPTTGDTTNYVGYGMLIGASILGLSMYLLEKKRMDKLKK